MTRPSATGSDLNTGSLGGHGSVGVEPVAERRDPQALLDAALGQARALLDERDALRAAVTPEVVRGALIRSGVVWVIPADMFPEAVEVITRELLNGPFVPVGSEP